MKIRFFGRLRDRLGAELELPDQGPCTVAELRRRVATFCPAAAEDLLGRSVRACLGDSIVAEDHPVGAGDLVEFLPPVSGG